MEVDLQEWLAHWRLSALAPALDELGAVHPVDLLDLDSDDVASLGLKKLELKRWYQALDDVRANAVAAPSPLKGSATTSPFRSGSGEADDGAAGNGESAPPQSVPAEGKDGSGPHFTAPGSLNESTILGGADRTAHYLDNQTTAGSLLSDDSKASRSGGKNNGSEDLHGVDGHGGGDNAAPSFGLSLSGELDLESALAGHHREQTSSEPAEDAFLNPCALTGRFEDQAMSETGSQDPLAPQAEGGESGERTDEKMTAENQSTGEEKGGGASEKAKEEAAENKNITAAAPVKSADFSLWTDAVQVKERGFLGLGDSWTERFLSFNASTKTLSAYSSNPKNNSSSSSSSGAPLWERPVVGAVSAGHHSSSSGGFSGQRPHRFNVEFADGGALVALAASSEDKLSEWLQRLGSLSLDQENSYEANDIKANDSHAPSAEDAVKGNGGGDLTAGDSVLEVFDESTAAAVVPPSPLPPPSPAMATAAVAASTANGATSEAAPAVVVVPSSPSSGDSVVEVLSGDERELASPSAQTDHQQQQQQASDQTHVYNGDLSAIAEASAESLDPLSTSDRRSSPVTAQPSTEEQAAAANAEKAAEETAASAVSNDEAATTGATSHGTSWACGVCKRDNAPNAKACGVCFTKRSYEGGRNSPLSPKSGASTLSSSSSGEDAAPTSAGTTANNSEAPNDAPNHGAREEREQASPPELVVLIVTDHPQLEPFGPVIEYNGRDAFELGACGTVVAPLDGRDPHSPLAQFFFQRYEQFHPSEQPAAIANTQQLYDQLLERSQEKHQQQQQASRRPTRQRSQPRRSSNGTSSSSGGEDELKAAFRRRSSASQGRAHSSGGNDNHSPETRRRLTLEALKEEEASSGASHLTGVLQNLRKAPRPTPAKGEKLLERSAYSLDDTSGGGGDHDGSGGQSTGLYARSSLRRSSMDNLLEEAAAEGQATSATDLWKEALLKKERKKREKLEREAAEAAAAEAAAAAAAEASALMSPGGGGHGMEPPATARKEITKGAVARAKLALMDAKKAEEEARMAAELKEARELKAAEAHRLAEEEAARLQAEAEEAALPELQRHMLRRQRAREAAMREEEARLAAAEAARQRAVAAAEAQAAALEAESLLQDELNESEASGRGNRRKSDKIKALQMSIAATSSSTDDPLPGSGSRHRKEKGAANKDVPTVFIASDDPRLVPFGPVIEYNGQDAFEIGAVGGVMALLDATSNQPDSTNGSSSEEAGGDEGFFVFNHLSAYGPEEREAAIENTTELVHRLQAAQEAARAAELPNPLAKYGAALTGSAQELLAQKADAQRLAAMREAAHTDSAAAATGGRGEAEARELAPSNGGPSQGGRPANLGRRQSSGFKGKKRSVAEVIAAVGSGGGEADTMGEVVDLSAEAVFQMKPDEKMADLCAALVSPTAAPVAVLKLRDCGLGDGAVQMLASRVLAHSSARALVELDLSMNTAIKEDGALALAAALASNDTLKRLDLTGMPLLGKSERVLRGFVAMYDTNFTLEKIVWRLDHPLANTLARLMTRNNVLATKRREQQLQGLPQPLSPSSSSSSSSSSSPSSANPLPELVPVAPSPTRKNNDLEAVASTAAVDSSHIDVSRAERISKVRGAFEGGSSSSRQLGGPSSEDARLEAESSQEAKSTAGISHRPHRSSLSPPRQQQPPPAAAAAATANVRRSALDPEPRPPEPPRHSLRRPSPPSSSFRAGSGSPLRRENHSGSNDQQQRSPLRPSGASKLAAQNTLTGSNNTVHRPRSQWEGAFNDDRGGQTLNPPSEAKLTANSEAKKLPEVKSEAKQLSVKPEAKQAKQPHGSGGGSPRGFRASELHFGTTTTTTSAHSHSAAGEDEDDLSGGMDVSGMDPLAFLEAQHQRLEARRRKRQALLAGLDSAQEGGAATASASSGVPVKGALPMPPTAAAAAREQARVAAIEAKAAARSGAKATRSGAGEAAEKKPSHQGGAGSSSAKVVPPRDVTADGRPLERVSLRPLTPLQPFVAEAKDSSHSGPSSPSDPVPSADLTAALTKLAQERERSKSGGDEHGVVDVDVSLDDDDEAREDAELGVGDDHEEEDEDEEEVISTIFLVSDDPRLQSFGQVYCFNGRDTFTFGEEKTVQTTMDASEGGGGGEGVFFIYPENAFTAEQLPQAREHTDFLVMHLEEVHTFQAMGSEGDVQNGNHDNDDEEEGGEDREGNNEDNDDEKGSDANPGPSTDTVGDPTPEYVADGNNDDGNNDNQDGDDGAGEGGDGREDSNGIAENPIADSAGPEDHVSTNVEPGVEEKAAPEVAPAANVQEGSEDKSSPEASSAVTAVATTTADEEGEVETAAPSSTDAEALSLEEDNAKEGEEPKVSPETAGSADDDISTAAAVPFTTSDDNEDGTQDLPPLLPDTAAAPEGTSTQADAPSSSDLPGNSSEEPTSGGESPTSPPGESNNSINNDADGGNSNDVDDSDAPSLQGESSPLLLDPASSPPSGGVSFGAMLSRIDCQTEDSDAASHSTDCSPRSAGPFQEQDVYPVSSSNENTPTGVANSRNEQQQQQQRNSANSSGNVFSPLNTNENRENMDLNSPDHSPRYAGSSTSGSDPESTAAPCSPSLASTNDKEIHNSTSPAPHSVEQKDAKPAAATTTSPLKDWSLLGAGNVEAAAAEDTWQTWLEELGATTTGEQHGVNDVRGSDTWWLRLQPQQDSSSSTCSGRGSNAPVSAGESAVRAHAASLLLSQGCPPSQRRRLWGLWSGADELRRAHAHRQAADGATTTSSNAHYPADYSSLCAADACVGSNAEDDAAVRERIAFDAAATCPDLYFFQHGGGNRALCRMATALHRLLVLYAGDQKSEGSPSVPGYDTGMTQLAAFVLLAFKESKNDNKSDEQIRDSEKEEEKEKMRQAATDDSDAEAEEDAFWTLAATVMYRLAPYYSPNTAAAQLDADSAHLSALVAARAPAAASQLTALEFEWVPLLVQEWWRALFFDALPPYCALHLWDLALFHGARSTSAVLVWVAAGIACSGSNGDALARATSCQEAVFMLRTAALELKQLSDLEGSPSVSSSGGGGCSLAEVTKRLGSVNSTEGSEVSSR